MIKNFRDIACFYCGERNQVDCPKCASCGKPLSIHEQLIGQKINELLLVEYRARGFYALTFRAIDERGKTFAVKLIAEACYKRHNKDFELESRKYAALPDHPCVARYISAGIVTLEPSDGSLNFFFLQSEWVEGISLKEWLSKNSPSITEFTSLATDVLSALQSIHDQGLWHNDLHEENILVSQLSLPERMVYRRESSTTFKIVDIGSMEYKSPEAVKPVSDMVYVGNHLTAVLARIKSDEYMLPVEDKAFIRAVIGVLNKLSDEGISRSYKSPMEALYAINDLFTKSRYEDIEITKTIKDPYGFINANDIYSPFLIIKMYSPKLGYFNRINEMDQSRLLISGPRGCGKTMILKFMRFVTQFDGRDVSADEFIYNAKYIGLFISARSEYGNLLVAARSPGWSKDISKVGYHFNLLITLELMEVLYRLESHGIASQIEIEALISLISDSFVLKTSSLYSIKSELVSLAQSLILEENEPLLTINNFNCTPSYVNELCRMLTSVIPLLRGKDVVLLVDDLSWPRIPDAIMMSVIPTLFNPGATYKTRITAHSEGLVMTDHAGGKYEANRDYTEIKLGREYFLLSENYDQCREGFDDIMDRRFKLAGLIGFSGLETVLGRSERLSEIGSEIRKLKSEKNLKSLRYHGSHVFVRLCSGDLSYLVEILGTMNTRWGKEKFPISVNTQNEIIRNYARNELRLLRDTKTDAVSSLYDVGLAFGVWSREQLIRKSKEHLRLDIEIYELSEPLFAAIRELLAYGLFIDGGYTNTSSGRIAKRLLFRRIYTPAFPTTFNDRDTFNMRLSSFTKFISNPKEYVKKLLPKPAQGDSPTNGQMEMWHE